jgi:cysteinyl-tRNA synthetase
MAVCSLGSSVDVLLGGSDLTFPHHAYQVAMVEAASGVRPFAQAVVHVGEVRRDGAKMAKSTGNLVLVTELLDRHAPSAVRFGLLNRRWADPWDCDEAVFVEAAAELVELQELAGDRPSTRDDGVLDALADDLDVPRAVAVARDGGAGAVRYLLDVLKVRHR